MNRITRRAFLAQLAVVAAGTALGACAKATPDPAAAPTTAKPAEATAAPQPTAAGGATAAAPAGFQEAPMLADLTEQGKLPPVADRLPIEPCVVTPMDTIGKYGGRLSSIVADPTADLMEIDGIHALGVGTRSMDLKEIIPNVAKGWELSDDYKALTIFLREGLKWSDGTPLTTADVQFWYEDILLNEDLTPTIDNRWQPGDQVMELEVVDDFTFRLKFAAPHAAIVDFLPGFIPWAPKHYLSQWHIKHNDEAAELAKSEKFETWVQAFEFHNTSNQQQQDTELPVLKAWVYERQDQQGNRYYTRNPYYWKVDTAGNQLPYTDGLDRLVVENKEVLNARVLAGEGTHHMWFLSLANYPLYKENEQKGDFTAGLYPDTRASEMGFCFNYTHRDEVLRELFNDVRWRQAMSHAIDRDEINEMRFAGLGVPRQPIMDPGCSFFKEGIDQYYVELDVDKANALLDDIGLDWDAAKQFRLRPDGQPLALTMEVDAGRADLAEVCNLIKGYWAKVGVDISVKSQDQQFYMQRMTANEHDMGVWAIGGSSEVYSRANEPIRYRPPWHWSHTPLGGPLWRQWLDTEGEEGMEPPEIIKELWDIASDWRVEPYGTDRYRELGEKMLQINAENCWCIGTVGLVPKVGIVKNTVRNAPKPGAVLSIEYNTWTYYVPEHWWIED